MSHSVIDRKQQNHRHGAESSSFLVPDQSIGLYEIGLFLLARRSETTSG